MLSIVDISLPSRGKLVSRESFINSGILAIVAVGTVQWCYLEPTVWYDCMRTTLPVRIRLICDFRAFSELEAR